MLGQSDGGSVPSCGEARLCAPRRRRWLSRRPAGWLAGWLRQVAAPEWFERYGKRIGSFRFPKGADARQQWALAVGEDGFALLQAVYAPDAPAWLREIEAVQALRVSWVQQYHRDERGAWREGKDLPPVHHRLCSPYDTDARYGIKRGSGWTDYKAHLTETCEPHAPHVITQVAATDAVVADTEMTEPGHRALAERELLPDVHVVDAGYTTAALFLSATERGMELLGPAPHDSSRQSREDQGFSRADFAINWDNESAICPGGHRSFEWWEQKHHRNDTPVLKVFFETSCTKPPSGRRGRGITFLPRERHEALRSGPPGPGDRQLEEPLRDPGRGRRHDLPGCPCHRPAPHPLPRSTHDPLRPRLRRHRDQPHPHQTDG